MSMLLAVDTSTTWIGLALYDGVQAPGEVVWRTHNHHTVELAPAVDGLLKRVGVQAEDLEALAVALGPGSFTSLRIGLALVKGLALALRLPVIGVSTLDVLAASQPVHADQPLVCTLQVGRGRLAAGWYAVKRGRWKASGDPCLLTLDELAEKIEQPTRVCGELDAAARKALGRRHKNAQLASPAACVRRPSYLAELAWKRYQSDDVDEVVSLSPIYLHTAQPIED
jgi:tRNA threonylcarbamoyladenosine biosynthesis protein TsaB